MNQIEAIVLTALGALSVAACTRSDANSHGRTRGDDQATIVINAQHFPAPVVSASTQEQGADEPPHREQAQTIVVYPHASLEPAKVESVVAPIEFAAPKQPSAPQAKPVVARTAPLEGVISPSADNANLSAVTSELSDLLRELTAPGGKAGPDSPLMKSIQSGNAPQPETPASEGR
jgi:hypothetical protein